MANLNLTDVQPVDPVLTNMMVEYMQGDERFVADRVFPPVPVATKSGTYFNITKKYFFLNDLEERAAGANFARLDWGASTATYNTLQWAADVALADEVRADSQIPGSLEQLSVRRLAQANMIRKEVSFDADFLINNVWGTTDNNSTTDWDDFSAGDPALDVTVARRTISNNTGYDANSMVVGYIVHQALSLHPDMVDRIKYTTQATAAALEGAIAASLGLANYWVAKATYANINEAATFASTAIIDDKALVCHVDPSAGLFGATSGKTFVWGPGGGSGSVYRYRDASRHADVIQQKAQWDQVAVATDLGYLFLDVV